MSDRPQNNLPAEDREEILRRCRPEDFDGHTHFAALTAEQRLDWLDETARFVVEFKGAAQPKPPSR
jgi:hypothetical protein